jgi:exoribonuclease R
MKGIKDITRVYIYTSYMINYKIHINNRNYTDWEVFETINFQKVQINISPLEEKLFANDVFILNAENKTEVIHSSIRTGTNNIPGVLVLEDNKTYGRQKGKKQAKLLYKCIPDDMRLPAFLVPYELKHVGFSKVFTNLYVTFTFNEWDNKHPVGTLTHVIGPVNELSNFYEYQLYCKSLNASIQKFHRDTTKAIEKGNHSDFLKNIQIKYPSIQDRTDQKAWNIFTIDPAKSLDFDDGFSIVDKGDGVQQLSIYISNVTIWMDSLNLWDSFSRRISTIYLPDKKRPMLPTILSDCLCSLQENVSRIAFVMDLFIQNNEIIDIQFHNCLIKVTKNYTYEEPELLDNDDYVTLFDAVKRLSRKFKYINNVKTSHDVVCYLMIIMNYHCAKKLLVNKTGIFRSTIIKQDYFVPDSIPEDVSKFIKIWNSVSGQYIDGSKLYDEEDTKHEMLDIEAYIHITSPIRRLVDLLNMIKIQEISGMIQLSDSCISFYNQWLNELEYINITMRAIRKVQCECSLLDLCCNKPEIMDKEYDGYLFDKIERNDFLYQYIVFLPELKLSSRITLRDNFENFTHKKFKMFLFHNEENFKRKIRLQVIET